MISIHFKNLDLGAQQHLYLLWVPKRSLSHLKKLLRPKLIYLRISTTRRSIFCRLGPNKLPT